MVGNSAFLKYKTSQMAAAALMLSINIHQSNLAVDLGLPRKLSGLAERSSFFEAGVTMAKEATKKCPIILWNKGVRRLTGKCVGRDVLPCYRTMIMIVNEVEFEGRLSADASLFPQVKTPKTHSPSSKKRVRKQAA